MEIYKITNKVNGKCYIGKTSIGYEKRFKKHKLNAENKINRRLYDAMNYYGYDNFTIEVLDTCIDEKELAAKEIKYIKQFNSLMPNGYNMTLGGDGGYTLQSWSEEDRKRLYALQAMKRTGKTRTEITRKKISEANKGKVISKEARDKISVTLKNRYKNLSKENKLKVIAPLKNSDYTRKNIPHTDETKKLMSNAKKGKTYEEIYTPEEALKKCKKARDVFLHNNPNSYELTEEIKSSIKKLIHTKLTANEISIILKVSLYKIRQTLKEIGINNIQTYRRKINEEASKHKENS